MFDDPFLVLVSKSLMGPGHLFTTYDDDDSGGGGGGGGDVHCPAIIWALMRQKEQRIKDKRRGRNVHTISESSQSITIKSAQVKSYGGASPPVTIFS